jgi:cytochrome c-type biogenesis protein CcmH
MPTARARRSCSDAVARTAREAGRSLAPVRRVGEPLHAVMTTFLVVAALLVAAGVAWLLWPLRPRAPDPAALDQSTTTLAILRAQLADLDAEQAAGRLDAEQHRQASDELQRRVLEEAAAAQEAGSRSHGRARLTAIVVGVLVPLAAALLYWQLGTPRALDPASLTADAREPMSRERIEELVQQLAARMEKEPGNAEGWGLLARTYYAMQRYDDAVKAYEKLAALLPQDADVMADLADALAMAGGRRIAGRPLELVQAALARDPQQWKALAMAGTEAFERKDYRAAVGYWERLRAAIPADSPLATNIAGSIDEARRLGNLPAAPTQAETSPPRAASGAGVSGAAVSGAGVSGAGVSGAGVSGAAVSGAAVSGEVRLAPELATRLAPGDTVFVTARAAQGPRIPLAVQRLQGKELPASFRLDDALAMAPNMKLSGFAEVVISARVSRSGQALPQSGDLESAPVPVKSGASGVILTIDRVVP